MRASLRRPRIDRWQLSEGEAHSNSLRRERSRCGLFTRPHSPVVYEAPKRADGSARKMACSGDQRTADGQPDVNRSYLALTLGAMVPPGSASVRVLSVLRADRPAGPINRI